MLKVASNSIDVQEFQFKLQCRLKIFDVLEGSPIKDVSSLIASASRFGLLFTGCNSPQLKVIRFASIEDYSSSSNSVVNYSRRDILLPSVPQHINVNCDHTILSVIVERDNCPVVLFYDVKSFLSQNILILNEVTLSTTQGVTILEANWHPTVATIFTDCKTDGTLGVYELKGNSVNINKLPAESNATCFCWSPKGKQIAVGSKNGKLTHYKPDLKTVKVINAPPFEKPHIIISVQWISTYQFIGIFKPSDDSDNQCSIVSIDAPKTGTTIFTIFDDICYSNGSYRAPQYYMIFEQHWNILIVASSNSMEVGVLALQGDSWVQWTLPDSARAELPLDENREETYPIGIAIDTSSVKPVPWGESSLQPAPSLLILSHQGVLCCFKIINLKEGAPGINLPLENFTDLSGLGTFTTGSVQISKSASDVVKIVPPNTQPPLAQNVNQQISSTQIQKETKPIQSAFIINPIAQSDNKSVIQTPQLSIQTQSTEPAQKALLSNESKATNNIAVTSLFGGQVTITPTYNKPLKSMSSVKGSVLLSNMNTGIPISVSSNVASGSRLVTPKLSNQQLTTGTGVPQAQLKIVDPTSVSQVPSKQKVLSENVPTSIANQFKTPQENSEEIEKILSKMVQMECSALEKELKIILFQGKNIRINLDPQSMDTIVNQTQDIDDFIVELIETSESQSSEIHVLKQNTVQSWAWLEEARSRLKEYQNAELSVLFKSKPLDSVSEKHLHTLKQMEYYLDSQVSQAHKALDEQWDKFQEYCRKINRVQLPTMEAIFQTMVKQNAILQKHDFILKYIASQIRGKKRSGDHASLFNHTSKNKSLEDTFHNLKLEPEDIYQIYYQKIMNRIKLMPQSKSKQLRRILQNRDIPHVKVASKVAKSVLQRTPEKKDNSIFVHMTPTSKQSEVAAKTLNFYQSTPLTTNSNHPLITHISGSAHSAFASTNIGISTGKSSYMSKSGFETGNFNTCNVKTESMEVPSKLLNTSSVKMSDSVANTTSEINFSSVTGPKTSLVMTTGNDVESKTIIKGQPASNNLVGMSNENANSNLMSASLLKEVLQSKTTSSQVPQKLLFMPTKSTSSTGNVVESPIVSSGPSRTSSEIKIQENTTSSSTPGSIFSSAFTKLMPSTSTQSISSPPVSTNLEKSTDLFSIAPIRSSLRSGNSSEQSKDMSTEQICALSLSSASTKPTSSCSVITVSTAVRTKPFFTPITSEQLNISVSNTPQQMTLVNLPPSKPSAFTPLASTQSPVNTLNSSMPTLTTIAFSTSSCGKSLTVSSNIVSTSLASLQQSSSFVTPQNVVSTQSKPLSALLNESSTGVGSTTSIFGNTIENQSGSIFNSTPSLSSSFSFLTGNQTSMASTTTSLQPSLFTTVSTQAPVTKQSIFSNSVSTSATTGGIFGPSTTTSSQIFGSTTTTGSSLFGSTTTTTSSIFSSSTPSSSKSTDVAYDTNSTSAHSSTTSPFTGYTGSIFHSSASIVTSTNSGSLFGSPTEPNTKSIFNTNVPSSQSAFGSDVPFSSSSTFSTASSAPSPIFGSTTVSTAPFGNAGIANFGSVSSQSSPFNVSTSTSSPIFGGSIPFGTPSISFGASTFVGNEVSTSLFGVASTSGTPFGSTTTSSLFGNATTTAPSPFSVTPTSSAPAFAAANSSSDSPFGKPSVFGQPSAFSSGFNTTQTTTSPIFGQTTSGNSSVFGNPTTLNAFGGTTTSSTFGTAATPFGATSSGGGTSLFDQTTSSLFGPPKSIFGGTTNTENLPSSFGFGGLNVGASTQSHFAKTTESKSPFGGGTFSNTSSTGSLFGSSNFGSASGGSIFGQSTFGSSPNFGNTAQQPGPFSGGSGSVSQAGFGTATAGIGVQPPFGGSPTFGAAPTFGGAPTFGSTSSFGSPNKVFGSASPTGVFGTTNQQNSGFGNLADQNTIGFGSLAQSANNPGQSSSFSGNSSFSSWR